MVAKMLVAAVFTVMVSTVPFRPSHANVPADESVSVLLTPFSVIFTLPVGTSEPSFSVPVSVVLLV